LIYLIKKEPFAMKKEQFSKWLTGFDLLMVRVTPKYFYKGIT